MFAFVGSAVESLLEKLDRLAADPGKDADRILLERPDGVALRAERMDAIDGVTGAPKPIKASLKDLVYKTLFRVS